MSERVGAETLISRTARERLLAIARAIPDLGDTFGFECRLGTAAGRVDLGVGIRRRTRADERVAPPPPPSTFPPEWQRFAAFCLAWWDPSSLLHSWVPFVFLEFDADAAEAFPVPSVFVSLDWPLSNPDDPRAEASGRHLSAAVVREGLGLLWEPPAHPGLTRNLDTCIHRLPDGGRVVHAGAMLGRAARGARLSIAMPRHTQEAYLAHVGLPKLGRTIESIVASLAFEDATVHLELDVAETIGPRVGVVLAREDAAGWDRVLHRLGDASLCTPDEKAALLDWPQLSHIKITPADGSRLEAKAYLLLPPASALPASA